MGQKFKAGYYCCAANQVISKLDAEILLIDHTYWLLSFVAQILTYRCGAEDGLSLQSKLAVSYPAGILPKLFERTRRSLVRGHAAKVDDAEYIFLQDC